MTKESKYSEILLNENNKCLFSYIYIYTHIFYHENNVPSRLLPQWLCGNSCTWAHEVRLHIAGTNEPKSAQQAKQGA